MTQISFASFRVFRGHFFTANTGCRHICKSGRAACPRSKDKTRLGQQERPQADLPDSQMWSALYARFARFLAALKATVRR